MRVIVEVPRYMDVEHMRQDMFLSLRDTSSTPMGVRVLPLHYSSMVLSRFCCSPWMQITCNRMRCHIANSEERLYTIHSQISRASYDYTRKLFAFCIRIVQGSTLWLGSLYLGFFANDLLSGGSTISCTLYDIQYHIVVLYV